MSKVIKAIIVVAMLVGLPNVGMSTGNTDNSMGSLEDIRSKTALAEAQIIYLEATLKLKDLQEGKTSKPGFEPMKTPTMDAPPMVMSPMNISPMNMLPENMQAPTVSDRDEVIDVMGVDGKYTATIRTGSGIYKVSKGDKLSGGVLEIITLDKVVLKKAGKAISLPFAE